MTDMKNLVSEMKVSRLYGNAVLVKHKGKRKLSTGGYLDEAKKVPNKYYSVVHSFSSSYAHDPEATESEILQLKNLTDDMKAAMIAAFRYRYGTAFQKTSAKVDVSALKSID